MSKKTLKLRATGIDHVVYLHVRDLARSKKFYMKLLGMKVYHENPVQVFLQCNRQAVALFKVRKAAKVHAESEMNHMALRLRSGNYREVKTALEKAGVKISGRRGDLHCIYFNDPDGHRLQLLTPAEQ